MKKYKKILFGVIAALVLCVTSVNFSEASEIGRASCRERV